MSVADVEISQEGADNIVAEKSAAGVDVSDQTGQATKIQDGEDDETSGVSDVETGVKSSDIPTITRTRSLGDRNEADEQIGGVVRERAKLKTSFPEVVNWLQREYSKVFPSKIYQVSIDLEEAERLVLEVRDVFGKHRELLETVRDEETLEQLEVWERKLDLEAACLSDVSAYLEHECVRQTHVPEGESISCSHEPYGNGTEGSEWHADTTCDEYAIESGVDMQTATATQLVDMRYLSTRLQICWSRKNSVLHAQFVLVQDLKKHLNQISTLVHWISATRARWIQLQELRKLREAVAGGSCEDHILIWSHGRKRSVPGSLEGTRLLVWRCWSRCWPSSSSPHWLRTLYQWARHRHPHQVCSGIEKRLS